MKKLLIMAVLAVLVAAPAMATSVVGSKHDMIASGFAFATGGAPNEVCIFCHTPHAAQTTANAYPPLWNNSLIDATSFYGDPAAPGGVPAASDIDFPTSTALINATDARVCLACHDGSVSEPINKPNVLGGDITVTGGAAMSATASLGDMSNDHPIGMDLGANPQETDRDALGHTGMHTIAEIKTSFGGDNPFFGSTDDTVNIMYCSSCHDVHDSAPLKKPFLRKSNVNSALCKACHIK